MSKIAKLIKYLLSHPPEARFIEIILVHFLTFVSFDLFLARSPVVQVEELEYLLVS